MTTQQVQVDRIRIDGGTQPREFIDEAVVAEYAEAMTEGAQFPPVSVVFDGVAYWLADGFHRYHASRKLGWKTLDAEVTKGTKRNAILLSVAANTTHGMRRTNADKRKAVKALLADDEWGQWSNVEIATLCGVGESLVRSLREKRSEDTNPRTYTTKHGTTATMNTANIGRKPGGNGKPQAAPASTPAPTPEPDDSVPTPHGEMLFIDSNPTKAAAKLAEWFDVDYLAQLATALTAIVQG